MADTAVEKTQMDVVEPVDVALSANDVVSNVLAAIVTSPEMLAENGGHLEKTKGPDVSGNSESDSSSSDSTTDEETGTLNKSSERKVGTGESSKDAGKVKTSEQIVELEFDKVKPMLDTHTMHCPNCYHEVTRVILRKKTIITQNIEEKPDEPVPVPVPEPKVERVPVPEPKVFYGCFSCFNWFIKDNDRLNEVDIFGGQETGTSPPPPDNSTANSTLVLRKEGCLSMLGVFRNKPKDQTEPKDSSQPEPHQEPSSPDRVRLTTGKPSIGKGDLPSTSETPRGYKPGTTPEITDGGNNGELNTRLLGGSPSTPYNPPVPTPNNPDAGGLKKWLLGFFQTPSPDGGVGTDIESGGNTGVVNPPVRERSPLGLEILKSIVYGGLMEVIASLSVVASAAASEATTLNIVALSLASLVGGILVIGHNLWDLKNDSIKESLIEGTNKEATNKYKELLGRVNYFPLHAFLAILSFVIFGMVPPMAYGYAFDKTSNRDYIIVAVAIASLICVTLLATFKAYISKSGALEYIKTVVYYITTAASVSGVSYAAGNLATRLLEELGLFDTSSSGGVSFFPRVTTPSLASF